jgi:hypothetical protein
MFSMRPRDQQDHRCGQEQLFLPGVPASAAPCGKNPKKHETQRAGANVEEIGNPAPTFLVRMISKCWQFHPR